MTFGRAAGPFRQEFGLELSGAGGGQQIRYVIAAGSAGAGVPEPTATSPVYTTAIPVDATVVVRAAVFSADGRARGPVSTAHYVKFSAAITGFSSQLPVVVIDSPGRDSALGRAALARADTLVTPINDSFVDFDLIGQVDPDSFKVRRPSFYAEMIWDARKARARVDGGSIDWLVVRNRLSSIEAHNRRRVGAALDELAKRIGFRVAPGLSERVIYRELFPKGLTLLDMGVIKGASLSHVAARQELRQLLQALALPLMAAEASPGS